MNKTITIYELLGLIKDGKPPKKIEHRKIVYTLNKKDGFSTYYSENYERALHDIYILEYILDEKVEILEEDKHIIEKIKRYEFKENGITISEQPSIIEIADKLNEVIDCINRKEDK